MSYFSNNGSNYFEDDFDLALEKPISVKKAPERENTPRGVDRGGLLTSKSVGITSNPTQNQVDALQASIRSGASKVELGFMGTQKGSSNAPTPESMSKEEREMIYQLARLNEVETTVHAAPSVSNLSGFNPRQNTFDEAARDEALNEIRRAIDFAADASTGGAVVVHWDEWQRSIEPQYGIQDDKGAKFQGYQNEYIKGNEYDEELKSEKNVYGSSLLNFVNTKTNEVQTLRRDLEFTEPVVKSISVQEAPEELGNGKFLKYEYEGFNPSTGQAKTTKMDYEKIVNHEIEMNEDEKFKDYQEFADENFEELREKWKKIQAMEENTELQKRQKKDAIFLFHFLRMQADKAYDQYLSADSSYRFHARQFHRDDPKQKEDDERRRVSAWTAFKDQLSKLDAMQPVEEFGTKKAAETVAEAAMYAWERSKGNKQLSRNLYIAPESIFPQSFGSHPDEMMAMIKKSREEMTERLLNVPGAVKNRKEAEKEAEKHIRATLDVGHLNLWRRHLKKKEGESTEEYNKRFNKWAIEKSKEMAEKGYVGHAHMTDNFGFGDEHLSVGQGNAPIKEFIEALRDTKKVDDFVVEVGSYNATTAQTDAWEHLGISMGQGKYFQGKEARIPGYFGQVRNSPAGYIRKPSFVFGKYAPQSNSDKWQGWAPWSGSPI